jgi:hypothetical protein
MEEAPEKTTSDVKNSIIGKKLMHSSECIEAFSSTSPTGSERIEYTSAVPDADNAKNYSSECDNLLSFAQM